MVNRLGICLGLQTLVVMTLGWGQEGKFPLEKVISINSGYFRNENFRDLLVTHEVDTIRISTGFQFRTGHYSMRRLTLLGFNKGKFEVVWQGQPYIARSSPSTCIYSPAWCHGNFDNDPRLEIVELENGAAFVYDFDQGVSTRKRIEYKEGAIDQAIGWNFDGKGGEEILALNFTWEAPEGKTRRSGDPETRNSTGIGCRPLPKRGYRISVLSLSGGNLSEVWAGDFDELPSSTPIGSVALSGKMVVDGSGVPNPVLREPQSDLRGSRYMLVSKTKKGNAVEIRRPFPEKGDLLPVGDLTFLKYDRLGASVHGTFLKNDNGMRVLKTIGNFQNGRWTSSVHCETELPGTVGEFAVEGNRIGWIHVHEGRFQIWRELPECKG